MRIIFALILGVVCYFVLGRIPFVGGFALIGAILLTFAFAWYFESN